MSQPEEIAANEWEVPGPDHVYDEEDVYISPEEMVEIELACREAEEDIRLGRTRPLDEVFAELETKYPLLKKARLAQEHEAA